MKKWASHFYSRGRYDGLDDGYSLNWPKAVSVVVVLHASLAVAGLKQWLLITCLARSSLSSILSVGFKYSKFKHECFKFISFELIRDHYFNVLTNCCFGLDLQNCRLILTLS